MEKLQSQDGSLPNVYSFLVSSKVRGEKNVYYTYKSTQTIWQPAINSETKTQIIFPDGMEHVYLCWRIPFPVGEVFPKEQHHHLPRERSRRSHPEWREGPFLE